MKADIGRELNAGQNERVEIHNDHPNVSYLRYCFRCFIKEQRKLCPCHPLP